MTDPAIEAAHRACGDMPTLAEASASQPMLRALILDVGTAAREALKPIRELHVRVGGMDHITCATCGIFWPCETAKLIYTTEELTS